MEDNMFPEGLSEMKKWLSECQETHDELKNLCCDAEDNIKMDEKLENNIKKLFPIFNEIPDFYPYFVYQSGDAYETSGILDTNLRLLIEFGGRYKEAVELWFSNSFFSKYDLCRKGIGSGSWVIDYNVKDLLADIVAKQVQMLHEQLDAEANDFLEAQRNVEYDYIQMCLDNDPHYLGVRFVAYTGEWPTYCNGSVILEIEGERVVFNDFWSFGEQGHIPRDYDFGKYERYRNEIIRVVKENVSSLCCGGCE